MIDPQLDGKIALITGANHGIGEATAKKLAALGSQVFITYYIPHSDYTDDELEEARLSGIGGDSLYRAMQQQSGEEVAEAIRSAGGEAAALDIDLGQADNISALFDQCEADLGPVDILIANHAHSVYETFDPQIVSEERPVLKLPNAEGIDRHFAVNARAAALLMNDYLQRHIRRGASWGRIITLVTTLGHGFNISYAASKNAVASYSYSAAANMGRYGITVNVVRPGATQTGYITPEHEQEAARQTPLGRLGEPDDVADVIVFLASEQARWITGQLIPVTGGARLIPS